MSKAFRAACVAALALLPAVPGYAATDAELAEIRNQIKALKDDYEARIRALEERLKDAESRPAAPTPSAGSASAGLAAFNPAISVVLQGTYANLSQDPNAYAISGFRTPQDLTPGKRGFSLGESELTLSANVDDKFAGQATFALTPENTVSVEEAYGLFSAAPYGLAPKFGRFFSGIGYLNEQHQHAWDFVDAPLAYQAFLGGQYANDGVQVKWVAPLDQFVELGAEAGSGASFPGSERNRNGVGSGALYAHTGGDVGDSHSWRAGFSWLRTRDDPRSARDDTAIADFTWKWAPHGNPRVNNFKVQGEYFRRRETGDLDAAAGSPVIRPIASYEARQSGWYLQGVYQFMPMWRAGARIERLDAGSNAISFAANEALGVRPYDPRKASVMVDWTPSEFSRVRMQYARSQTLADVTDNQFFVQYILSLGAHGAHKY